MGKHSFSVPINPEALRFAIAQSGYEQEELVEKVRTKGAKRRFSLEYLKEILQGQRNPLYTDLKYLDTYLKRGIPFYFLSQFPNDEVFANFRKKNRDVKIEPDVEVKLREYASLRRDIAEMLKDSYISIERNLRVYTEKESPEKVAEELRKRFVYVPDNFGKSQTREAFQFLRNRVEEEGIFVFKDNLGENTRGCLFLKGEGPPLLLINSSENKNAEIFTLLHELAHYLLDKEELDYGLERSSYSHATENWCDRFAFRFLFPESAESREQFTKDQKEELMKSSRLEELSKTYKVSKHALMFRFYLLNIISGAEYKDFKARYSFKEKEDRKTQADGGGDYYKTNRSRLSGQYIAVVAEHYRKGRLSLPETLEYLRVKDFGRAERLFESVENG